MCLVEEYIGLDDNKYIGDLLSEFKAAKDRNKLETLHCKLTFKKRLFRESDDAITDPMFVQLSYVQVCGLSPSFYFTFNNCLLFSFQMFYMIYSLIQLKSNVVFTAAT